MCAKLLFIVLLACTAAFAQNAPIDGVTQEAEQTVELQRPELNTYFDVSLSFNDSKSSDIDVTFGLYYGLTYYFHKYIGVSGVIEDLGSLLSFGAALNARYIINATTDAYALGGLSYIRDDDDYIYSKIDSTLGFFMEAGIRFHIHDAYIKASARYLAASSESYNGHVNLNKAALMGGIGMRF